MKRTRYYVRKWFLGALCYLLAHGVSAAIPESGIWAIDAELDGKPGRGFFIEVQGDTLVLAFYGYQADGAPRWYLSSGTLASSRYSGTLDQYAGGNTFGGAQQSAHGTGSEGLVLLEFTDDAHGRITLPGEPAKAISRYRFGGRSFAVVDTGQTRYYNERVEIAAPAAGQPFRGQDAAFSRLPPNYTLSSDGRTVRDNVTQLVWMRGPNTTLNAPLKSDKKTYTQAIAWVDTVNAMAYGGYRDWRLPTIKELYSLMNFRGTDPSGYTGNDTSVLTPFIDTTVFSFAYGQTTLGERIIDSQYASSTVFVVNPAETGYPKVFGLNLADGRIKGYDLMMPDRSEKTFFVQLVRGPSDYGVNNFLDNGDGTTTDLATGLTWARADSGSGMSWQEALAWVQAKNAANYLGYNDWRLPDAKELHSLVNYANAPDYNGKPAIDTRFFDTTPIANENGEADYPYFWSSTTHANTSASAGGSAVYIAFGRALGWPDGATRWVDVHGAGAQRSDPKIGPPYSYATVHSVTRNGIARVGYAFGPQGDALRGSNFVRMVR